MNGFSPGTPPGHPGSGSLHGLLHFITAGVGFGCLITGCFVLSRRFHISGNPRLGAFSTATGVLVLAAFAGIASGSTSALIVLSFTAAVILAWSWLALTAAHLRWPPASHLSGPTHRSPLQKEQHHERNTR